ncbi:MAG TPA: ribonuclease Z [Deltaproteobacteria bacterium]|nr:ribonuclease Z [Deltaproteobacteria bacterium]
MSVRELVVLGTASQVPTRHRNHNGYLLLWDGRGILFDPGEGTQRQMIRSGVSASMITRICVTHFHGDHCLGLAGMIQRISLDGVPHEVPIHYPASGQVYFDRLRRASIFKDMSTLEPSPVDTPGPQHTDDTVELIAIRLSHTVESWGYRIQEPDGRRILPERLAELGIQGQDIGTLVRDGALQQGDRLIRLDEVSEPRPGQAVAIVMDTRPCRGAVELARGVDLLICESTYLDDARREAHERGHMTARDAAELAQEAGVRRLVLTHFSQRYPAAEQFLEEAARIHGDCVAARDGLRVDVPKRRRR